MAPSKALSPMANAQADMGPYGKPRGVEKGKGEVLVIRDPKPGLKVWVE